MYSWLDQWQRVWIPVRENFELLLGCHFTADFEPFDIYLTLQARNNIFIINYFRLTASYVAASYTVGVRAVWFRIHKG